ncbi:uncharacterized protein DNG_00598 [Cephalotrichum gorgonifer]|uniref:Uncharacterized protein n=1 Tax=Cephalotrichum gorgonifer TaxID=2041049 RepID=A0AAE8MRJ3_9PEZI|nr:uncharacterized protein DNG_00598 [Cephalotrichum gorgonifer]
MTSTNIPSPSVDTLLSPLLPALPTAAVSTQPSPALLPLLSPILRQRVQVFSSDSKEPWLRLLSYDTTNVSKLKDIVRGSALEPHPVSGEVEIDWESDSQIRFRRVDKETFQARVAIPELQLGFQLVHCADEASGESDGWRIGEVIAVDNLCPFSGFDGQESVSAAEQHYNELVNQKKTTPAVNGTAPNGTSYLGDPEDDDDDDDDYWARYDATPARTPATRTPAAKRSPAPQSLQASTSNLDLTSSAEDDYFAQYDSVQPAMDNHDPDEARNLEALDPPVGLKPIDSPPRTEVSETTGTWTLADTWERSPPRDDHVNGVDLAHPRPASSASSSRGSDTVAKLEQTAERQGQSEFGVKQHISRSIRSLFLLSRAAGIDREEFEDMVRSELDVLGMMEGEE